MPEPEAARRFRLSPTVVSFISLSIITLVILSPLLILAVGSLKDDKFDIMADLGSLRAFWAPEPSLNNFTEVLTVSGALPVGRYLLNSLFILFATVTGGLIVNSAAGYVLAWGGMRGRTIVLMAILALYIMPMESIAMPLLKLSIVMGFHDSFFALIVPFIASPIYVFLFYQFFRQIPKDLVEAARMDGASFLRVFVSLAIPVSAPVFASVAILMGIDVWNQYLWPAMATSSNNARPISVAIATLFGVRPPLWDLIFAASVMMMIPALVFYLAFQRWFVQSLMSTAVKG